jgi:hypothetical protein
MPDKKVSRHCEPPFLNFGGDTCAARQCGEQSPYRYERLLQAKSTALAMTFVSWQPKG